MAGDWIKWAKGLTRKPEVIHMAKLLNKNRREVASLCMEVWEWADDTTADGNARSVTKAFLDEHVGVTGFADAMETVDWLLVDDEGLIFPNFDRHNGNSAKKRAQTQKRVAKHRDA